jgi:hypothetical protein
MLPEPALDSEIYTCEYIFEGKTKNNSRSENDFDIDQDKNFIKIPKFLSNNNNSFNSAKNSDTRILFNNILENQLL